MVLDRAWPGFPRVTLSGRLQFCFGLEVAFVHRDGGGFEGFDKLCCCLGEVQRRQVKDGFRLWWRQIKGWFALDASSGSAHISGLVDPFHA
jgi:hypothetical protein